MPVSTLLKHYVEKDLLNETIKFNKDEQKSVTQNIIHHLQNESFPTLEVGTILYFLMQNDEINNELAKPLLVFMFKHMQEVPLNDIALSLQLIQILDTKR